MMGNYRIWIKIKVNETTVVDAMIDTGACCSVITNKFRKYLDIPMKQHTTEQITTVGMANGENQKVLGTVELDITLANEPLPYEFIVLPHMNQEIILGSNFLKDFAGAVDYTSETVSFFNKGIVLNFVKEQEQGNANIMLLDSCTLQPRSETLTNVYCKEQFTGTGLIAPNSCSIKQTFSVARSLVCPKDGKAVCRILNPTNEPITLKKDRILATIQHIDNKDIQSQDDSNHRPNVTEEEIEDLHILDDLGIKLENEKLSETQKQQLVRLIVTNKDLFAKSLGDMPGTDLHYHKIDTGDASPCRQRSYKHSPEAKKEIESQTADMMESGIIEPSHSCWSSPVLLVRKKTGEMRFCIDYRKLNSLTKPISFPLPLLTDVFDAMSESAPAIFSLLDLKSGYHQIPMDKDSKAKTAFSTHQGSFQWNVLPFGLMNAPSSFQMLMSQVFRGMTFKHLIIYIDDLLVYSKSFSDHLEHLQAVFDRLRGARLRLHPKKCNFALTEVMYLGHVLTTKGVKVDEKKIDVVKNYPVPKSVKDVRSFLGYVGYYRKFVRNFAAIASPLHALLKKENTFQWTNECQEAFENLRTAMTTTPVLMYADMSKPFILTTDASTSAIGYILSQTGDDGQEHPIAFNGRALRTNEQQWCVSELEGLALVEAVKEYHAFLSNNKFVLYTDHISLTWLQQIKAKNGRLLRWSLLLQGYIFEIKFKSGKSNNNADALSRREYPEPPPEDPEDEVTNDDIYFAAINEVSKQQTYCTEIQFEYETSVLDDESMEATSEETTNNQTEDYQLAAIEPEVDVSAIVNLAQLQRQDTYLGRIIAFVETGELPAESKLARQTIYESEEYFFIDDILHHKYHPSDKHKKEVHPVMEQLVIPECLKIKLLQQYHDNNGHPGFDRCYETIREKYWFKQMYTWVRNYTKSCTICQKSKIKYHAKTAPLQPLQVDDLFARYHMDILGPLPRTRDGYKYILLVVESLSRYPETIALKTQEASEVATALWTHIFSRYGAPLSLVSDRGQNFMSHLVTQLCNLFNVARVKTSSFRPQTNSACERYNSTILKCLRCYCDKQEEWIEYLPSIMAAYRATPSISSTQFSPFFVMHGREMRLPLDNELIATTSTEKHKDADEYVRQLLPKLEIMRKVAQESVKEHQEKYKQNYDKHSQVTDWQPGTRVLLFNPKVPPGKAQKLYRKWMGPYYVTMKLSDTNYIIRECGTNKEIGHPVHVDRLKLYYDTRDEFESDPEQTTAKTVNSTMGNMTGDNQAQPETELAENKEAGNEQNSNTNGSNDNSKQTATRESDEHSESEETKHRENRQDTNQTAAQATEEDRPWFTARELLGIKTINGRRHYKVAWEDAEPTWECGDDISDFLIREFHIKRTYRGNLRKEFRNRGRKH